MERLFTKRFLIALLCTVFLLSIATLVSTQLPFQKNRFGSISTVQHTTPAAAIESDDTVPDPEDAITVDTTPTPADAWTPKQFDEPSLAIRQAIERNIRKEKRDRILLVAVANQGMADYTLNWIESLKRTDQDGRYLVFAIDDALVDTMTNAGHGAHVAKIPDDWFHKRLASGFAKWLDKDYTPITHAKTLVVERLLYMDVTVWFSDVDIVFTHRGVYRYLLDKLNARKTEVLFTQETEQKIVNSGFYIMRPTSLNKRILADSIVIQDAQPKVTQQRAINRVLDDLDLSYHTSPVALLDLPLFPHGRLYFERSIPKKYDMEPMIVHANYRVGDKKREALQNANLWYL